MNFNICTTHKHLTPFLVAAKYSRKDAVLWMLGDDDIGVEGDREDKITFEAATTEGRNALHLTAMDKQSAFTVEVYMIVYIYICMYMHDMFMYMYMCC